MGLASRIEQRFIAKGAEGVDARDAWLDNDDIRPLALKDRRWSQTTYFTFWFSAVATGEKADPCALHLIMADPH